MPCFVENQDLAVDPSDSAEDSDSTPTPSYATNYFDRQAFYGAFAEIRTELDAATYHKFYYAYR